MSGRSNKDGEHWLDEIQPKFSYSMSQLMEPLKETRTKLDELVSRINRDNSEAVKDIYTRVLTILHAERKQRISDTIERPYLKYDVACQTDFSSCLTQDSLRSSLRSNDSTASLTGEIIAWDSEDMRIIREHYKQEHEQFLAIRAELKLLRKEFEEQLTDYKSTRTKVDQLDLEVSERDIQIKRLNIINQNLKSELKKLLRNNTDREEEKTTLTKSENLLKSQLKQINAQLGDKILEVRMLKENAERRSTEVKLDAERDKVQLELEYQSEISDLTYRISNLTQLLEREQQLHEKSKLGLEHLQKHYSYSNEVFTQNQFNVQP